jgi:hypothetical protein
LSPIVTGGLPVPGRLLAALELVVEVVPALELVVVGEL